MNLEKSKKDLNSLELFNSKLTFTKILLRRIYLIPYLLIFTYGAFKTLETSKFNLVEILIIYVIVFLVIYLVPSIILIWGEKKYIFEKFEDKEIKCHFCNEVAQNEFGAFPKLFYIPLCQNHNKEYSKSPEEFFREEQKIYNKYNEIIFGLSATIVLLGTIAISVIGVYFGIININTLAGTIILLTLLLVLLPTQLFTHFYFTYKIVKMIRAEIGSKNS